MKKILFVLSFFTLYLFSDSVFCSGGTVYDVTLPSGFQCGNTIWTKSSLQYSNDNGATDSPKQFISVNTGSTYRLDYYLYTGSSGHQENWYYVSSTSCPDGTVLNSDTGICETPDCPSGQHLLDGVCVADCNTTVPTTFGGYSYLADFTTSQEALDYVSSNNIQNGYIQSASSLGAPEYCTNFYVYGELPQNDPCLNVTPPLIINGFSLHDTFTTFSNCTNFISNVAGGQGLCKQFDNCSKVFAYYNIDTNNTFIPDVNNTLPPVNDYISDNDNNYSAPANIDDNNDSVDMSPVLNQLSDLSQKQHDDLKNLANKADVTNNNLNSISNKIDITNNNLNSISQKLDDIYSVPAVNLPDLSSVSTALTNAKQDMLNIKSSFDDTLSLINNGFDVSLPQTTDYTNSCINVFNHTICFDFFSSFVVYRPIFVFIFELSFLYFVIKIFLLGLAI